MWGLLWDYLILKKIVWKCGRNEAKNGTITENEFVDFKYQWTTNTFHECCWQIRFQTWSRFSNASIRHFCITSFLSKIIQPTIILTQWTYDFSIRDHSQRMSGEMMVSWTTLPPPCPVFFEKVNHPSTPGHPSCLAKTHTTYLCIVIDVLNSSVHTW